MFLSFMMPLVASYNTMKTGTLFLTITTNLNPLPPLPRPLAMPPWGRDQCRRPSLLVMREGVEEELLVLVA